MYDSDCTHVYIFHVMFVPLASLTFSSHGLKLFCFTKPRGWSSLHSWPLHQTPTTLFLHSTGLPWLPWHSPSKHSFYPWPLLPFCTWNSSSLFTFQVACPLGLNLQSLWEMSSLPLFFQEQFLLFLRVCLYIVKYDHIVFALPTSPIAPQHGLSIHIYALYVCVCVHTCVGVWVSVCVSNEVQ